MKSKAIITLSLGLTVSTLTYYTNLKQIFIVKSLLQNEDFLHFERDDYQFKIHSESLLPQFNTTNQSIKTNILDLSDISFIQRAIRQEQTQILHNNNKKIFVQILSSFITSLIVSPLMAIIDKSVIENANGKTPIWEGAKKGFKVMIKSPKLFMRSFEYKCLLSVCMCTYTASNLSDYLRLYDGIDSNLNKLTMTFAANSFTGILKDRAFTQRFGVINIKPLPANTIMLFFVRDSLAMLSAFVLPSIIVNSMSEYTIVSSNMQRVIQLTCPGIMQVIATPLHLLGLDLYNRQSKSLLNRFGYIRSLFLNVVSLRVCRFVPAYGIGGVINREVRARLKQTIN